MKRIAVMYYRLRFKSYPKIYLFELLQEKHVQVRDVIRITRENFRLKNSGLVLYSQELENEHLRKLNDEELIVSGRTYIVKRQPLIKEYNKRKKYKSYKK